jgi:hypothetical protein
MTPFATTSKQSDAGGGDPNAESDGLNFGLARSIDEVVGAWRLVHHSYCRQELIEPNQHRLHLVSQAIHPDAAVVVGCIRGEVVSTMTVYPDAPEGLPLDRVYGHRLRSMREQGRRPVEVGLFADRREKIARSVMALMGLMRQTFFYAVHSGATDIVIGVHPHHAGFYERCFGFAVFDETAGCPSVGGSPMVPLRLKIAETYEQPKLPRGLAYFKANPLGPEAFAQRIRLSHRAIAGTCIAQYLNERARAPMAL